MHITLGDGVARPLDWRAHDMSMPVGFGSAADETLQRADRSYRNEQGAAFPALTSAKVEILRHYDVPGMDRAVAICAWGRSGSLLLTSSLDGHDDVAMLPAIIGQRIYRFFHEYESLSVWEKLVAYPAFSHGPFFQGDPPIAATDFHGNFPIAAADYYAAIHALFSVYGDRPAAWLDARRRFFQFLHVA